MNERTFIMTARNHRKTPGAGERGQDSGVALAIHKHDITLARIDGLINDDDRETLSEIAKRGIVLYDIVLRIDFRFKMPEGYPGKLDSGRPADARGLSR